MAIEAMATIAKEKINTTVLSSTKNLKKIFQYIQVIDQIGKVGFKKSISRVFLEPFFIEQKATGLGNGALILCRNYLMRHRHTNLLA